MTQDPGSSTSLSRALTCQGSWSPLDSTPPLPLLWLWCPAFAHVSVPLLWSVWYVGVARISQGQCQCEHSFQLSSVWDWTCASPKAGMIPWNHIGPSFSALCMARGPLDLDSPGIVPIPWTSSGKTFHTQQKTQKEKSKEKPSVFFLSLNVVLFLLCCCCRLEFLVSDVMYTGCLSLRSWIYLLLFAYLPLLHSWWHSTFKREIPCFTLYCITPTTRQFCKFVL